MNIEQLVFTMYKDEKFKGRKDLRDKIKRQFKDITGKQLSEITLRIYNYQVDKYGEVLINQPDVMSVEELKKIQRQAKQRKYGKKKYYQNQGRM